MNEKTLEYYMSLPYKVEIYPEEDGTGYTAVIPELPGCMTSADTYEELSEMLSEAKELWLEVALEEGMYIPEPAPVAIEEYSGKFLVRLPRSLHRQLAQRAKAEDTSLNQLVLALLSESMGRWTERRVHARRRYGNRPAVKPIPAREFQRLEAYFDERVSVCSTPEQAKHQWDESELVIHIGQRRRTQA